MQDVERECGQACVALNLPLPTSVSMQLGEGRSVFQELASAAQRPTGAIPETTSFKVRATNQACRLGLQAEDAGYV